jgi:hypothetical protein
MKRALLLLTLALTPAFAQLTPDQKEFDMRLLAALFDKHYAPYEWNRMAFGFDLLSVSPWVARAREAPDDLAFYELCIEYVASLRDAHSRFAFPSAFTASLGFQVDIYEGKPLVDRIDRNRLPEAAFPFGIGWELVSMDGKPADLLLNEMERFVFAANPRSRRRVAATLLTSRAQETLPRAHEIADAAAIVFRDPSGSDLSVTVPWLKSGTPVTISGRVPSPKLFQVRAAGTETLPVDDTPLWLEPLAELRNMRVDQSYNAVLELGSLFPHYLFPDTFDIRSVGDFLTGVFTADGLRIGLIRIPDFLPQSSGSALGRLDTEIAYMEANTDGLVVDVTRNNGGDACYAEEFLRRLIPYEFRGIAVEVRATTRFIQPFAAALDAARRSGADPSVIALLQQRLDEVLRAYHENRGRTPPVPICSESLTRLPAPRVYRKPLIVLTDEFSSSAADILPAILQDSNRGPVFGWRTMGAGGNVFSSDATAYSEASASFTASLVHRPRVIVTPEYPPSNYIENVGVRPDIEYDYMTQDNLLTNGRPFVEAFTAAIVGHIRANR